MRLIKSKINVILNFKKMGAKGNRLQEDMLIKLKECELKYINSKKVMRKILRNIN